MRRRSGTIAWLIIIAAMAVLFLAWQYFGYRLSIRTLPTGMTMAGVLVEGMTRDQALNALEVAFATPIQLAYQEDRLSLPPDTVELLYNSEQTAANLDALSAARGGLDGFIAYVLRRPQEPVDVLVAVTYSEARLDGFLARVAQQYDRTAQEAVPVSGSLAFQAGQPGRKLDIEQSRVRLSAALVSAADQQVNLVVQTEPAPRPDPDVLGDLLQSLTIDTADLVPGVFVKDLQTGDELQINADVAFAGLDVLKIAILEETYRFVEPPISPETIDWLSDTMGVNGGNFSANLLLRDILGNGDSYQGADNLTASMHYLGLVNTFMATPYDEDTIPPTIVTPANSQTDIATNADPSMQTTPLDIGLLLEMIHQCSHGGGTLMVAYPGELTADECSQMIDWMSRSRTDSLIEVGVPAGTKVAHKQGFTGDTHADAALVFSPGGDFVLVVFLYRPEWLAWEESAPLIADITTATYNYFNPTQ